jgi:hypothetical protein
MVDADVVGRAEQVIESQEQCDPDVTRSALRRAQREIAFCEHCHPHDSELPFDWLLTEVTGERGPYQFILGELARCPNCKHEITEKTLVEPKD